MTPQRVVSKSYLLLLYALFTSFENRNYSLGEIEILPQKVGCPSYGLRKVRISAMGLGVEREDRCERMGSMNLEGVHGNITSLDLE